MTQDARRDNVSGTPSRRAIAAWAAALGGVVALIGFTVRADPAVIASVPLASAAGHAAVEPSTRKAFIAHSIFRRDFVTVVDLDGAVAREIPLRPFATRIVADSARAMAYVLHETGHVSVVDARAESVVAEVALPGSPEPGALAADLRRAELYVGLQTPAVAVVDVERREIVETIACEDVPGGIAVDRPRGSLFVADCAGPGRVAEYDLATRALVRTHAVTVGCTDEWLEDGGTQSEPWCGISHFAVDERRGRLLAAGANGSVLDLATGEETTFELPVSGVRELVVSHAFDRWYLAGSGPVGHAIAAVEPQAAVAVVRPGASGPLFLDEEGGTVHATSISRGADTESANLALQLDPRTLAVLAAPPAPLPAPHPLASPVAVFRDPARPVLWFLYATRVVAADARLPRHGTRIAREFRFVGSDRYFVTADALEARTIEDGRLGTAWLPTHESFRAWTEPGEGRVPVCRFFANGLGAAGSHAYAVDAAECAALARDGAWTYEGVAFHLVLPESTGACPQGAEPLFRVHGGGGGGAPNYRLTRERSVRDAMVAMGWRTEGTGPDGVFACAPPLP
jgi:DNA-binding beta-propeller fold protein YncE